MSRLNKKRSRRKIKRIKMKRLVLALTLLVSLSSMLLLRTYNIFEKSNDTVVKHESVETSKTVSSSKNPTKININAVGDIMAHTPQLKAQYNSGDKTYDFNNNFQHVTPYISNVDLSIANLETTLAGPSTPYTSYPTFNTPDALVDALRDSGVDIISTINNHSFDKGNLGVERTLEVCNSKGFETVGTIKNTSDNNYIIKEVSDIKLGITSFSYGELKNNTKYLNGIKISDKSKDKMNVFDMLNVDNAFNTIKEQLDNIKDTDLQILIIHWGSEYQRVPSEFQIKLSQMLCDYGVDIIIGSHPHVVQPVEMIKSSNGENETLVMYSLGNFISNQRKELLNSSFTEDGLMVNIEVTKDFNKNKTYVSQVDCIPTWVNKYKKSGKDIYEIIPIYNKNEINNIENLPINEVKISYQNTISQIKQSDIIKIPQNPFE